MNTLVCRCGRYTLRGKPVLVNGRVHAYNQCDEEGGKSLPVSCPTPTLCRYDPVLNICDACGADVVLNVQNP